MKKIIAVIALVAAISGGIAAFSVASGKPVAHACDTPSCS